MSIKYNVCIVTRTESAPGAVSIFNACTLLGLSAKVSLLDDRATLSDIEQAELVFYRIGPKQYNEYVEIATKLNRAASEKLQSALRAFDKIETYRALSEAEVPTPLSRIVINNTLEYFEFPFVLKVPRGNRGIGVELVRDSTELSSVQQRLLHTSSELLAQEYIAESRGSDKRLVIAAGELVAAMMRTAEGGGFHANLHQGGSGQKYSPTDEEIRIAVQACEALKLDFAGVDIIDSARGPLVLEVNPSPGFGISSIVGFDVASQAVLALINKQRGE